MSYTGAPTPRRRPRARPQGMGYVPAAVPRRPGAIAARDAVRPIDDRMTQLASYRRDLELAQMTRGVTQGERRRMASGQLRAAADSSKPQIMTALGLVTAQDGSPGGGRKEVLVDNRGAKPVVIKDDSIPRPTSVPPPMLPAIFLPIGPSAPRTPAPLPLNPPPVMTPPPDPVPASTPVPVSAPVFSSGGGGGGAAPVATPMPAPLPIQVSTERVPETDITVEATTKPSGFAISPTMLAVGAAATVGLILLLRRS